MKRGAHMSEAPTAGLSPSVQRALDWASAVARVRERTPAGDPDPLATPSDLFVGAMLAHADADGEVRVLLTHFGLTARDIVGEQYARVTPANLSAVAATVAVGRPVPSGPIGGIVDWAQGHSGGDAQLLHLLGGMLFSQTELMTSFESAFTYIGESRQAVASSYESWLSTRPQDGDRSAGASLREWLQRNNPRAPVNVAGFSTDDISSPDMPQQDLVGISPEANALAYLVASRDLAPPLAVGLFGDWGSGKSFLMRDVRNRVGGLVALSEGQPQHEAAIWKNIQHIEFNAWEYVQGDLWAGLLEKIFQKLGTALQTRTLVEERQEPVRTRWTEQLVVVESAKHAKEELGIQVEAAAIDVTNASAALTQRKEEAGQLEGTVPEATRIAAATVLSELWSDERVKELGTNADGLLTALDEAWEEVRQGKALLGPYWKDWRRVALLSAAVAVVPLVTWLAEWLTGIGEVTSGLAGLAAGVPVLIAWLRLFTSWSQKQRLSIAKAQEQVRATHQAPVAEAQRELALAQARHAEMVKALSDQTATVAQEKQRALELEAELTALTPGRVFTEFADKRSTDYRAQLGFLGTVRADLRTIETEITKNNQNAVAPAPDGQPSHNVQIPNRIVLYIDDLDRCPPAKVVQVLEAVHLLLAFPLFVVFVAVDSRWLSSALLEQLHALRAQDKKTSSNGLPTARDYLEKIFQLPFWVQPLSGDDRRNIVSGLLAPTVRGDSTEGGNIAPGELTVDKSRSEALDAMIGQSGTGLRLETSSLALTPTELEFVASLGPLLGETPRRIKRFVNTVQFVLSVRPPLSGDGPHSPRLAAALFAAIHEGTPGIAREFFKESKENEPLDVAVKALSADDAERVRLSAWLDQPANQHWRQVTPHIIGERCQMVQRLSFDRPTQ